MPTLEVMLRQLKRKYFTKSTHAHEDYFPLQEEKAHKTPKGFLPVYVGEECKRYVVPLRYLSTPTFMALLSPLENGIDTKIDGPIVLPCTPQTFEISMAFLQRRSVM